MTNMTITLPDKVAAQLQCLADRLGCDAPDFASVWLVGRGSELNAVEAEYDRALGRYQGVILATVN